MTSPPTTKLNTRLTKAKIFPTTVMVHPPWVGPLARALCQQAAWSAAQALPADRFSPENERGGTMPPAGCSVNATLSRSFHHSFGRRPLAGGLSSQLLDTLVQAFPQLF